jgi:hypothetical protein
MNDVNIDKIVCAVAYFVGRDLTAELDHGSLV